MIETPAEILAHWAGKEAADSFCAWRRSSRKPLTETAARRICRQLAAIVRRGGDPADALGMAEEHGWQTIKEGWYFEQLARNVRSSARPGDRADPALEQIARLAGLGEAPRNGGH